MLVMPLFCKNSQKPLGPHTGQNTLKSNFFCQLNLTKTSFSLLNRDTCITFSNMGKLDKSAAIGAGMLGILAAAPAMAEDKTGQIQLAAATSGVSQQVDCKLLARNHEGTGKEKMKVYSDCRNGVLQSENEALDVRITEQQRIIAALNQILSEQQLRIDELGAIRDANGQELARIVAINGKLLIRRQNAEIASAEARARSNAALDEAERYILENS